MDRKLLWDCALGVTCMFIYPLVLAVAAHAWMHWDWISKTIWTVGSIYFGVAAAVSFVRVGRWIER